MRRHLVVFMAVNLVVIALLVYLCFNPLSLLFDDGSADAILQHDLVAPSNATSLIPKIIHHTWKDNEIPAQWKTSYQSCKDLHPSYEFKLWSDAKSRDFVAQNYPWFLETFDWYPYPIQRADVIRYLVLAHEGGVYVDLDVECTQQFDSLLRFGAWARRTNPSGISNDVMGSMPGHPFFLKVIKSLKHYARNWPIQYLTVMLSTGPLFLSVIWVDYIRFGIAAEGNRLRLIMSGENFSPNIYDYFKNHNGSSWHEGDAVLVFWAGQHWLLLFLAGTLTAMAIFYAIWFTCFRTKPPRRLYKRLRPDESDEETCCSRHGD